MRMLGLFKLWRGVYHAVMDIGLPPEFGKDGSSPPLISSPVVVARRDLDRSVGKVLLSKKPSDRAFEGVAWLTAAINTAPLMISQYGNYKQTKIRVIDILQKNGVSHLDWRTVSEWQTQVVYDRFYRREDPITQLAPGANAEVSVSLKLEYQKTVQMKLLLHWA